MEHEVQSLFHKGLLLQRNKGDNLLTILIWITLDVDFWYKKQYYLQLLD